VLVSGCGDVTDPPPDLTIGAGADWNWSPTTSEEVGYYLFVVLLQRPTARSDNSKSCRTVSPSLRVTANDHEMPLVRAAGSCLDSSLVLGPFMAPPPLIVEVLDGGRNVGGAMFGNLAPGAGATLASPANGLVHADDELVIVPPSALPSSFVYSGIEGSIYPLDQTPWPGTMQVSGMPDRQPDGVHVRVPAFTGHAALVLKGSPVTPTPMFSCDGFAICTAMATNALGPVFITGTP
jgi:hypothetical protein